VLLGLDSAQDLNRKDIADFILFPTGIHVPSSDQWFKRYALSNLMNVAEILRRIDQRETYYFEFWSRIEMKTPETLNTKHVDILLIFPTNICVPYVDKPSNGYGHWKTAQCKNFDGKLAADWAFKDEDSVWKQNRNAMERKENACDHSRLDGMRKPEWGMLELWSILSGKRQLPRKGLD
jgi:hypothetical protein